MVKQITKIVLVLLSSILIFACEAGRQVEIDVEVNVTLDGKPATQAKILLDGVEWGATDSNGYFLKRISRQPGAEVFLAVRKEATGYQIEPWKDSFVVKLPKQEAVEKYPFKIALKATKFITVSVIENGEPLEGASIRIQDRVHVKTDENGEYVHSYQVLPKKGVKIRISKNGYRTWLKTLRVEPGQRVEVSLSRIKKVAMAPEEKVPAAKLPPAEASVEKRPAEKAPAAKAPVEKARVATATAAKAPAPKAKVTLAALSVAALTEAYGVSKGIPDAVVNVNDKPVGKTNAKGAYTYVYQSKPGEEAQVKLAAPGYIPEQ
ncbi:MAG: hypothetical protein JSW12_17485, partial [Deltaproteobacteria bacterium]